MIAEIVRHLSAVALGGLWRLMSSAWVGYWLPSIIGACIGWFRNAKYPASRRIWISLIDGLAGVSIAFVLVFAVEFGVALDHFWNAKMAIALPEPPQLPDLNLPSQRPEGQSSLRDETLSFANDLYDWSVQQEGPINSWKQQWWTQLMIDSIRKNPNSAKDFGQRLSSSNRETYDRFVSYWWPRVSSLQDELRTAKVDTSPLSRAEASGDPPREIALTLSLLAERIGQRPPFPRGISPLQTRFLTQNIGVSRDIRIEVYSYTQDPNSRQIARQLLSGLKQLKGLPLDKNIHPLEANPSERYGIWVIYPSADQTTELNTFLPALSECQLEYSFQIDPHPRVPLVARIEVWPATPNWHPHAGPDLVR